jgi:hypothetical protein
MKFHFLLNKKFRQGQVYQLTEWNKLNNDKKEALSALQDESEVYGIFEPIIPSKNFSYKVAYSDVALLFFHLQHSNKLPHYLIYRGDHKINETIAAMLLDGIIEVEWEGKFVSGPNALPAIYDDDTISETHLPTYLSQLSYKAIYYAWMLNHADERSIASHLYTYNTIPWDASMKLNFYKKHSVKEFLFSRIDDGSIKMINEQWQSTQNKDWLSWSRKTTEKFINDRSQGTCKLYISPLANDLPEVFLKSIPVINTSDAVSFKIGNTLQGLLRPDKMVVYFYSQGSLFKTAGILSNKLKGYVSQGVPFSAQLDDNGLLSYGEDPPDDEMQHGLESGSWRTVIGDKLAPILLQAKEAKMNWPRTITYIEATMQATGFDIRNWEPTHQFNS